MPPPALVVTPGSASANSYCTREQADAYHEAHAHGESWRGAHQDAKDRALLTATRLLDEHLVWDGSPTTSTQRLQWPRAGLLTRNGAALDHLTLPPELTEMTAEFARQLLATDRMADSEVARTGLRSIAVEGAVSLTFDRVTAPAVIPDAVLAMVTMLEWGGLRRTAGVSRVVRT